MLGEIECFVACVRYSPWHGMPGPAWIIAMSGGIAACFVGILIGGHSSRYVRGQTEQTDVHVPVLVGVQGYFVLFSCLLRGLTCRVRAVGFAYFLHHSERSPATDFFLFSFDFCVIYPFYG